MEEFISLLETLPVYVKGIWIIACISIAWILEGIYPFINFSYAKEKHAKANLTLLGFTMLINVIVGLASVGLFIWTKTNEIGLLYYIDLPFWLELLLAIMFLDFIAQYCIHYLLHKIPFLWKFHMIHHSDTHVDVTSGTRHHPVDFVTRELFALIGCVLIGAPAGMYLFYRFCTILATYLTHANISIPYRFDKPLSYIFNTPTIHKFHHHHEMPWTDTNFGNIFSFWDRIFGTLVYDDPKKIRYGVDSLANYEHEAENVLFQLKAPFNKKLHK